MQGLVSVSFRKHSVEEIISAAKKANLKYIEWGSDVHAPANDIANLKKIKALQEESGIICSSYGTYFVIGESEPDELYGYINAAKMLGTNILRLWCGNKNYEDYTETECASLIALCKKYALIAEKNEVYLCMECHNNTFTNCPEGAKMLIKSVNSKNFLMYWQPNQFKTFDENIKYAKEISPYTRILHVFNWQGTKKFPLYDGIDTWIQYLKCFPENIFCLLEFMPDNDILSLPREAETLKEITKRRKYL
ncbi:MAG: TIM barrel protein [Clostridia bacterium]|nr:TIM barrel protein [Clostridia bacterium]